MATDQEKQVAKLIKHVDDQRHSLAQTGKDLEHKVDNVKALIPSELATRLAKVEERTSVMMWGVGLILAVVVAGGIQLYLLNGRTSALEKGVSDMDQTLKDVRGEVQKSNVARQASLPQQDFNKSLPDIGQAVTNLKNQKVVLSPPVLDDLRQKLVHADTSAPAYWPTAADFINYRSQITVNDIQSLVRSDLPNCTDHDPTPMELKVNEEIEKHGKVNDTFMLPDTPEGKDDKGDQLIPARYEDCRFILDSAEQAEKIPFVANKRAFRLMFKHCQIVYRGGPIALLAPDRTINFLRSKAGFLYGMMGQRLYFENCLFLFVMNSQPPKDGQWMTEQLLTQSGTRLTVTAPKAATHS